MLARVLRKSSDSLGILNLLEADDKEEVTAD